MTDQAKLLPCPFCGTMPHSHADNIQHNPDDLPWNGQWIIECNACPVDSSTWAATQDKAITQWNTRPPSERPVAQMREALADALDAIFDRIGISCNWRLSSEERQDIARAAKALRALTAERPEAVRENLTAEEFAQVLPRPEAAVAWRWRLPGGTNSWWYGDEKPLGLSSAWEIERGIFAIQHEEPGRAQTIKECKETK